jgi:hypothetical protein
MVKYRTKKSGAWVAQMTIKELLNKLDALEHPTLVTGSIGHEAARERAAKIIRGIIENTIVTIDNQKIKDAEVELDDEDDWESELVNKHIKWFFER